MANWSTQRLKELGYTREQFAALPLQERNKLLGISKEVMPDTLSAGEHKAQPASQREVRASSKPVKKTWTMKAGNNWEDAQLPEGSSFPYDIPPEEWPQDMALLWITRSIFGQEMRDRVTKFERSGWTAIHETDFDNWYLTVRGRGFSLDDGGFIVRENSGLYALPMERYKRLKERDAKAARDAVLAKEQSFTRGGVAATGADHPSALATNRINRSMERIDIPKE